MHFRLISLLLAVSLATAATAAEQRPRIGLVLSGGGARGAAHVGVLKVLEEMRIPIDVIAGASMGAVVGGLYAVGYDAERLGKLIVEADWNDNLVDAPQRSALSYRRKQDDRDFLVDFDIGIGRDGVRLPLGLAQGQKLNLWLKAKTLPAAFIDDFDKLPIPFRAVATDIETGLPVTLAKGDLATVLRASVSVPGVFAPVEYQDHLLIDGGVSNNLPIDVARSMGADVLIVVDIQFPLLDRSELRSALDITGQLLTILVIRESAAQRATLKKSDIVIAPDLGTMGSTEFSLAAKAVASGERAAAEQRDALSRLSVPEDEYQAYLAGRAAMQRAPQIDYVRIVGSGSIRREAMATLLGLEPGPLDVAALGAGINRLYGLNTFDLVDYELEQDGARTGLAVTASDRSWGPDYLNFGARLVDDLDGTSSYTLAARYTRTAINHRGAEWRNDLQIGTNPKLTSEFYQPLDTAWHYFFAPQIQAQRFAVNVFEGDEQAAALQVSSATAGLDFGRTFGNWGELRLGLRRTLGHVSRRIGNIEPATASFDSGALVGRFGLDTLDDANFPHSGWRSELSWAGFRPGLGSGASRDRLTASALRAATRGRNTWVIAAQAGSNLRGDGEAQDLFDLGGLFRLSGLRNGQIRGQHFAVFDLAHYRRLGSSAGFRVPAYVGASLELGNVWEASSDIRLGNTRLAGSLFLGFDTFVGPIYLAYGLAEGGQTAAYFLLGQGFN